MQNFSAAKDGRTFLSIRDNNLPISCDLAYGGYNDRLGSRVHRTDYELGGLAVA